MEMVEKSLKAGAPNASLLLKLEFPAGHKGVRQARIVNLVNSSWLYR